LTKQKICMREYLLAYSIFEVYAGISQKIQWKFKCFQLQSGSQWNYDWFW
jgi:hypothetical protein